MRSDIINKYKERKKISIIVFFILFIIILALATLITMLFCYLKSERQDKEMQEFYGTYELSKNYYFEYGENIIPFTNIIIDESNTSHSESKMITSNNFNLIKINDQNVILAYFNLLASINTTEEEEIDNFGLSKICFIKEKKELKQIDCPNVVGEQNLGSSIKNYNIEYKKIEN